MSLLIQTAVATFCALLGYIWLLFVPTFGHTGRNRREKMETKNGDKKKR